MAKQTFTTGQVLTAAQMTSLQQTAMGGGSATAKTASYTLVAADAGTTVIMNSGSATTITVNTALFAAGDTVFIVNQGAGVCTITAGTATITTAGSLAMAQNETGQLYFLSTSAAIFTEYTQTAGGGGKVLQVVQGTATSNTSSSSSSYVDMSLSASITPSAASSKVLALVSAVCYLEAASGTRNLHVQLVRGATSIAEQEPALLSSYNGSTGSLAGGIGFSYLDSPSTTSATTYKIQACMKDQTSSFIFNYNNSMSTITLMEIGA